MEMLIEYDKSVYDMSDAEISRAVDLLFEKLTEHPEGYNKDAIEYLRSHIDRFGGLVRNLGRVKLYFTYEIFSGIDTSRFSSFWLDFQSNMVMVKWTGD